MTDPLFRSLSAGGVVKTRTLFEKLGFQEDWEAITDQRPAYFYDFDNLHLIASEVMRKHFKPCFHFGGVYRDVNSITMVDFEMPLEVESFEQGVAWICYGIGKNFQPRFPPPWLAGGRTWTEHLPWVRHVRAYVRRPRCSVAQDWFRVAAKKLRPLATTASESDLIWLAFDGEALRITGCRTTIIVPATGTAWESRYAIKGAALDHLPKRLNDPVLIGIWDRKLSIGNRAWNLAQPAGDEMA